MPVSTCAQLISRFNLSQVKDPQPKRHPKRRSAVVMLLSDSPHGAQVLLCKRPHHLRSHPSQLCFPGGKQERQDASLKHTALRELHEELNIAAREVDIIGHLADIETLGGMVITPFVAYLHPGAHWQLDRNEVDAAFFIPFTTLAARQNWYPLVVERHGQALEFPLLNTPYGVLWGATERIINQFIKQLGLIS
ncbi:NUDIX hydrolase [Pseudoalteromonas sp. T1lg48]|uniref:NUDIX hydrolase n=1 Tax=Pseudoalteromonas sp. T1lg48 TaxID=2077100 RepID=UPI000CF7376A|nr:CoA pyrophosphatase [Pseudoalteromonas sp. T1lg48]